MITNFQVMIKKMKCDKHYKITIPMQVIQQPVNSFIKSK